MRPKSDVWGFRFFSNRETDWPLAQIRASTTSLARRGPDASGEYIESQAAIFHFRLSVTDPQARSNQPYFSRDGNLCLAFNGQIYNHLAIRQRLVRDFAAEFETESDTETLLIAFQSWGKKAFTFFEGDFAGFIYNRSTQTVLLFRDPVGTKPLYYHLAKDQLVVSSLLRPIVKSVGQVEINKRALGEHLALRYSLGEQTIFANIHRLPPSTLMTLDIVRMKLVAENYSENTNSSQNRGIRETLINQVEIRTPSAPYSTFLSSGIDSTAIALFSKSLGTSYKNTRALTFRDAEANSEVAPAAEFCRNSHLEHEVVDNELNSVESLREALVSCVAAMEEPIGDSICLLQDQLFKRAAQFGKVALSGEGADEIFAGYAHHRAVWQMGKIPPALLRRFPENMVRHPVLLSLFNLINPYPASIDAETVHRLWGALRTGSISQLAQQLIPLVGSSEAIELCPMADMSGVESYFSSIQNLDDLLNSEWKNWLPNYNLNRVDKLSMNHGLEVRVPFASETLRATVLDANREPMSLFTQKKVLRDEVRGSLPKSVVKMKKKPFTVGAKSNTSDLLIELAQLVLSEKRTLQRGFWNDEYLLKTLKNNDGIYFRKKIFNLLVLELWLREFID